MKISGNGDIVYALGNNPEIVARELGCEVVYPEPNQIQIDVDGRESMEIFDKRFQEVQGFFEQDLVVDIRPSRGGNRHITVTFPEVQEFSHWERVALQFTMGSDPVRESMNTLRIMAGHERPSRLFKPKTGGTNESNQ